ncbi:MAG: superoxide dismutase [Candidatus Marinimicrobia bacterium]|nr:superoxide dismutase [Candidatus Neomarinimicrobiota bacterium]
MNKTYPSILFAITILLSAGFILPQSAQAHCQIPCGIYDDYARLLSMLEDAATVEKSVNKMIELTGKMDVQSQNQMIRWVMNKEDHAQKVIDTISDYYLTQRVKPSQKDYAERLKHHHAVILAAMKAKQNADLKSVKALKKSISALAAYYPEHKH